MEGTAKIRGYRPIAFQPYVTYERTLTDLAQRTVVHEHSMKLYRTKICAGPREFAVSHVYDMSFRQLGAEGGILYLHTNQGVFPYTVKVEPTPLIRAFKKLVKSADR